MTKIVDCKIIWQFGSWGLGNATEHKERIPANYFVAIGAKDSYSINGEINNKIALKRGSFKYDILDAVVVLSIGSLLYQIEASMYVSYVYLCINKIYIIDIMYEIYDVYLYMTWHNQNWTILYEFWNMFRHFKFDFTHIWLYL